MKESQKQYTTRIEKELQQAKKELVEYKTLCNNLNTEIVQMQQKADEGFLNSSDYQQMNKRIDYLEKRNDLLEESNKKLEWVVSEVKGSVEQLNNEKEYYKKLYESQNTTSDIQKLNNEKIHNERGAGRKTKLTDQQQEEIKMYRIQGKTIKELAQMYNCSIGLIHKLISE